MRDTKALHPELQVLLNKLVAECKKQNLNIGIGECVRTVAEQDALYAKGRTAAGSIVTNAKGSTYSSMHQWGIAFDFFRNVKGKEFDNTDGFFNKVGKIGQSLGLEWGGSWKSFVDLPHFQLKDWGSTPAKLKKTYGVPENFKASWTVSKATNPYSMPSTNVKYGQTGNSVKWLQWELNKNGYSLVVDGDFGSKTLAAVKDYQKKHNLYVDGIVGPKTKASLI